MGRAAAAAGSATWRRIAPGARSRGRRAPPSRRTAAPTSRSGADADGIDRLGADDVAAGEETGDPTCAQIMEQARAVFAAACVSYVNAFNPTLIVVGGAIAEHQGERLFRPAREAVSIEHVPVPGARVEIVPAELGGDVSLAGALSPRPRTTRQPGLAPATRSACPGAS